MATVSRHSLAWYLVAHLWRAAGGRTRTDMLADALARWWFGDHLLEDLPGQCRFVFNASNLDTSSRYGFEREVIGDTVLGEVPTAGTGLRVADAMDHERAGERLGSLVGGGEAAQRQDFPRLCHVRHLTIAAPW